MLSKLSCDDLRRYGLTMGDMLDLFDKVKEKVNQTGTNVIQSMNRGSNFSQKSIDVVPDGGSSSSSTMTIINTNLMDTSSAEGSENIRTSFSIGTFSSSTNNNTNPMDEVTIAEGSGNTNDQTAEDNHHISLDDDESFESDEDVKIDDVVFNGFASKEQLLEMVPYDRKVFKRQIENYQHCVTGGIFLAQLKADTFLDKPEKSHKRKSRDKSDKIEQPMKKSKKTFKKSHTNENRPPPAEIKDEHTAFLKSSKLNSKEKKEIRRFLENTLNPTFSIPTMLSVEAVKCKDVETVQKKLESAGAVFGNDCKRLVEILMDNLYSKTENINLVTAAMREGLAVSLVATYPAMAHEALSPDDKPWSWIYDRKHNKGKLANIHAHKQRTSEAPRMRGGASSSAGCSKTTQQRSKSTQEKTQTVMYAHINDLQLSKDATYLKMLMPDDRNRDEIETYMTKTFQERRKLASDPRCPLRLLFEAFPKLGDFAGRMIDYEFDAMFPNKGSLLIKNFQDLVTPLLNLVSENEAKYPPEYCLQFNDSALNSLIILSRFLPKPKRVHGDSWEQNMNPLPLLEDFFHVVPVGSDVPNMVTEKRIKENSPVQPYIIATGTPKKLESLSLVLGDSKIVVLPSSTMPLKAVDLLLKSNFVFNTHFYLGWKYVLRFLAANLLKIPPENPRHSTFSEQYVELLSASQ